MRKLFFMLAFLLVGTFAFANNSVENKALLETVEIESTNDYILQSTVIYESFDVCTITVSIYHDGELVGSGTWSDNTGDCAKATRYATTLANIAVDLDAEGN